MSLDLHLPVGYPIAASRLPLNAQVMSWINSLRARTDWAFCYSLSGEAEQLLTRLSSLGLTKLRRQLSERDMAILRDVATWKYLSFHQIERLHFPSTHHATPATASRTCRRVLERLHNYRAVVRLSRRIGGLRRGSTGFIYGLGVVGHRLLDLTSPRPRPAEPGDTALAHTLAVADLMVELVTASRSAPWRIDRLEAEPQCWRQVSGYAGEVLKPDLFVALQSKHDEQHSFVEVDLGSECLPRLLRKCEAYGRYFATGSEQQRYDVFPRVVWVMYDAGRAARLSARLGSHPHRRLFVVTTARAALGYLTGDAS